jgi:hypothetical protein
MTSGRERLYEDLIVALLPSIEGIASGKGRLSAGERQPPSAVQHRPAWEWLRHVFGGAVPEKSTTDVMIQQENAARENGGVKRGRPFAKGNAGRPRGSKNRRMVLAQALLAEGETELVRKATEELRAGTAIRPGRASGGSRCVADWRRSFSPHINPPRTLSAEDIFDLGRLLESGEENWLRRDRHRHSETWLRWIGTLRSSTTTTALSSLTEFRDCARASRPCLK